MAHNNYFQFKQFHVEQNRAAMRVGTDGVLLGAWCNVSQASNVLDIGAGTGLISLMLAQRNDGLLITAIEIDEGAYLDAKLNFEQSKWAERFSILNQPLQLFALNHCGQFDLIVCNPPFFNNGVKSAKTPKLLARHTDSLPFSVLIEHVARLLQQDGVFAVVLPATEEQNFRSLAAHQRLFAKKITHVFPNPMKNAVRVLIEFGFDSQLEEISQLTIETKVRHKYTAEFEALTRHFYLDKNFG